MSDAEPDATAADMDRRRIAAEADRAVKFFDQVREATGPEKIAVGSDHWNWIEDVVRQLAKTNRT